MHCKSSARRRTSTYEAVCLSNIGVVYFAKYDTDNALIYYQQSLQLRQEAEPARLPFAETLSSLGDVHTAMGDYDQALASLMNALDIPARQMTPRMPQMFLSQLARS